MSTLVKTDIEHHTGTRYTHPETGAWIEVRIEQDSSYCNPIPDMDGVEIAYIGRDARHFNGTIDGIEYLDDCTITCPRCLGSWEDPDRWQVITRRVDGRGDAITGSGSFEAMQFIFDENERRHPERSMDIEPAPCSRCGDVGEINVSLSKYLEVEHDAVYSYESSTGGYSQGDDRRFVVVITTNDFTDNAAAAEAIANEYAAWARGDVYWAEDMEGERCHGLIGDDGVQSFIDDTMPYLVNKIRERVNNNIVLGYN